jgi:hypothetical protein
MVIDAKSQKRRFAYSLITAPSWSPFMPTGGFAMPLLDCTHDAGGKA